MIPQRTLREASLSTNKTVSASNASRIALVILGVVLAVAVAALLLGPRSYPSVGVTAARILSGMDAIFVNALPTPWFRWFVLWSLVGAAISAALGLLVLPQSTKAPSNFERSTIATAELSRVVVIVLAVAISFFDFITAPKPTLTANAARQTDAASTKAGAEPSAQQTKGTLPKSDLPAGTANVDPKGTSVKVEAQTQSLSASAKGDPLAPPSKRDPQPATTTAAGAPTATQSMQTASSAITDNSLTASSSLVPPPPGDPVINNDSLAEDLPWEKPRDTRTGARPKTGQGTQQPGVYGSNPRDDGRSKFGQPGYGPNSSGQQASTQTGQSSGPCDSIHGKFYNVKAKNNPDLEATIEIMSKGRGLIRMMTRRGEVLLMDARVTNCTGGLITVFGANGRREDGISNDGYREDVFVAPYARR
jgi:hypothetical protein